MFYGWWDWRFCGLMVISTLADYFIGLALTRVERQSGRRLLVALSLLVNLGMLGFFKYYNFFIGSLAESLGWVGIELSWTTMAIVLPVGISFYTFQTLSYTLDLYYRRMEATRDPIAFAAFVSFFPQLVAGPIERAADLLPQFLKPRTFDPAFAATGCRLMLWGLFMKMVLADNLGTLVDATYGSLDEATGPGLIVATVAFAFQIFCDFGGYSLIAIGTARLFGVRLSRNFAHPYFSQDVAEFWRRWHISLSTWFPDYVYIPLGGSRGSKLRRSFNILVTFAVSGLWHGASWNFVIWGLLNGIGILPIIFMQRSKRAAQATPGGPRLIPTAGTALRIAATFAFICLTWVFFRAKTLPESLAILGKMGAELFDFSAWGEALKGIRDTEVGVALPVLFAYFVVASWISRGEREEMLLTGWVRPVRWVYYSVLFWCLVLYGTAAKSGFIYFQF